MKAASILVLLALWIVPVTASATGESVGTIDTLYGKSYRDCHIVRVHPDGVSFRHATGAAKVLFTDLSDKWRRKFGYDPKKADAYAREIATARAEDQARQALRYKQMAEAQQRAHEMRMARVRAAERQAAAYAPIPLIPGGGPVPFIGSPLGQTNFAYGPQSTITGPAFGGRRWRSRGNCFWHNGGFVSLGGGSGGTLTVGRFSPLPRFNFRGYPTQPFFTSPTLGAYIPGAPFSIGARLPFTGLGAVPGIGPNLISSPAICAPIRTGGISVTISP